MPTTEQIIAEMERYLVDARALDATLRQRLRDFEEALAAIDRSSRRIDATLNKLNDALDVLAP